MVNNIDKFRGVLIPTSNQGTVQSSRRENPKFNLSNSNILKAFSFAGWHYTKICV